jgi:chromate transporter
MSQVATPPSFREAVRFWTKLGWIGFGGPTGQIAILHEELVVRRGWISEAAFLQGLNFCLMLPGPEAQQFATYLGWRLHGARGALAAGILFFLPAMFILWGLSLLYVTAGTVPTVASAFHGLEPAVLAIIVRALLLLARRTLKTPVDLLVGTGAAVLMIVLHGDYPLIIFLAALAGSVLYRGTALPAAAPAASPDDPAFTHVRPRVALLCLAGWLTPLLAAFLLLGRNNIVVAEGLFFTKAALVTFGGAYVVLPYVTQHAVTLHHWLSAPDMLHGVALAGTIPGPLVIVTQFVAFVGAWHHPGGMPRLLAATLAALLTTWVTFAPSFFYILVGGPLLHRLVRLRVLQGALRAISAAVVGVMIDFALWFGGRLLFPAQRLERPDWFVLVVGAAALFGLVRFRLSMPALLAICAVLGVVYRLAVR